MTSLAAPTSAPAPARNVASPRPRRWALGTIAVIGLALVVMPLAFGMFTKAPNGAVMISQFKPFMTTARLDGYQTDLAQINAGVRQSNSSAEAFLEGNGGSRTAFDADFPTFVSFDRQWPAIDSAMTHLMNQVQGNLGNYLAVAALPSFQLFPWFFVIPGALLFVLAAASLLRPAWWRGGRWALVVLGVALITAPVAFQMFQRAPKGGQMMTAFKTIETTPNVQKIQGYFGTMAEGQGAIRLEIVPSLEKAGLTSAQITSQFPAVSTLDAQWIHILNDMTPMIGAMSDNVAGYQEISSLPPFPLFPWFFVLPGVIVAGLALAAGSGRRPESADPLPVETTYEVPVPEYQGVS
jgi:hypothetical protein